MMATTLASWEHVSSKLGSIKGETRSIAKELYDAAVANGHEIWFMWGMGPSTEHSSGLALDLMIRNKEGGDFLYDYIWRNRARLRLRHVIWWQHITSTVTRPGVRRLMSDRGNSTANHLDHLHVLVIAGSYTAPVSVTPPVISTNVAQIKDMQKTLNVSADGKWGSKTDARALRMRVGSRSKRGWPNSLNLGNFNIKDVQSVINTKVDGIWGPNSQAALIKWIKEFQKVIKVKVDGWWGSKTDGRFLSLRRRNLYKY